MESEPERDEPARAAARWQISLRSMIVLVLAAGVSASLVAGAREVWGTRPTQSVLTTPVQARPAVVGSWPSSPVPVQRTAGVLLEVAAVLLIVLLARDVVALARLAPAAGAVAPRRWPAIFWRAAAVGLLLWFVACETSVLRLDFAREIEIRHLVPGWGGNYSLRQDLLPVCGLLVMLGLALGMGADPLIGVTSTQRARPWWALVPLAAIVALLIASQDYFSIIPYLILIALEAVTIAMRHRLVDTPSLSARLIQAGFDVIVPVAVVTALALLVARDFDRTRRGLPSTASWSGRILRAVLILGAGATGVFLARVVMPAIHPCLPQGFALVFSGNEVFAVVVGFGVFAMGLAARSLDHRPALVRPRWLARLTTTARACLLLLLSLLLVRSLPTPAQVGDHLPPSLHFVLDANEAANGWLWGSLPDWLVMVVNPWFAPEMLFWAPMLVALACLLAGLAIRPVAAGVAPLDRALTERGPARRLAWLVLGLTTVCLAALPTLVVAGQVVYHLRLNALDLQHHGWPR
jgi:hypothetical protein